MLVSREEIATISWLLMRTTRFDNRPIPQGIGFLFPARFRLSRRTGLRLFTRKEGLTLAMME